MVDINFLCEVEQDFHGISDQRRLHKQSGDGAFPTVIYIPKGIDVSTVKLIDDGIEIPRDQYELRWEDTGELIPLEQE
jgi:hypothetical protein